MAKQLTPARMRAVYTTIAGMKGVDPDVLAELQGIQSETNDFTSAEACGFNADSFRDLAELAGITPGELDGDESDAAPAPPKPAKSGLKASKKTPPVKVRTTTEKYRQTDREKLPPRPRSQADEKLLEGLDDEQCRQLVHQNDKKAREARQQAELAQYKSDQLLAGKPAAEVEALTYQDLKKRRTLRDITKAGTENLVHSVVRHLGSKSATLKALPDRYKELRDDLERQAAEHVAEFVKKEAAWVNATLLKAMSEAPTEVPA